MAEVVAEVVVVVVGISVGVAVVVVGDGVGTFVVLLRSSKMQCSNILILRTAFRLVVSSC